MKAGCVPSRLGISGRLSKFFRLSRGLLPVIPDRYSIRLSQWSAKETSMAQYRSTEGLLSLSGLHSGKDKPHSCVLVGRR